MRFSLTNDERNQLIVRHLDSVHAAANTFKVQPWIRDELISAGYEALVLASTRFDPSSNATFAAADRGREGPGRRRDAACGEMADPHRGRLQQARKRAHTSRPTTCGALIPTSYSRRTS